MLKYLFFDFGGCIDAPGVHTRTLFWEAFAQHGILAPEQKGAFQDAYSLADQRMMKTGIARNLGLRDFNRLNGTLIAQSLNARADQTSQACDSITNIMEGHIQNSKIALQDLSLNYPLGLISNFTGNLEVILREYGMHELFHSITESFYVGASKPEEKIFIEALKKQKYLPNECLFVGDNPVNDIAPAKRMGMQTVLIHTEGHKKECGADAYILDLRELPALIHKI